METTPYYEQVAKLKHPEVTDEWVARIVNRPEHTETRFVNSENRTLLYGFIEEIERWDLVIFTEDGRLLNRYVDRAAMKRWGEAMQKSAIGSIKLTVYYDPETDTLSLWNGRPACEGGEVGEGLTADYDAEGEVVGITLDGAAKLLTPYLWERTAPESAH